MVFRHLLLTLFMCANLVLADDGEPSALDWRREAALAVNLGKFEEARKACALEAQMLLEAGRRAEAGQTYVDGAIIIQAGGNFPLAESLYENGIDLLKRLAVPQ
jgi:hypothetical protein